MWGVLIVILAKMQISCFILCLKQRCCEIPSSYPHVQPTQAVEIHRTAAVHQDVLRHYRRISLQYYFRLYTIVSNIHLLRTHTLLISVG